MKRFYLFLTLLASVCFHPASLFATDNAYTLGGGTNNELQIVIGSGGTYMVNRYINNAWSRQFFSAAPLFSIKIGSTVFQANTGFTREDISAVTTGTQQHVTKKFSGTYNSSYAFSVTLTITYNTSSAEYLVQDAVLDMRNIPGSTSIIFAYGFDTYVNLSDRGFAYIIPDFLGYNNSSSVINYYMTTAQVQSLRMVGASNSTGNGALIGFFAMGRQFDRAYSANPYSYGYSYQVVNHTAGNGSTSGTDSNYKFQFGPFSGGNDNGTGVGFDNITPGVETSIRTGLTFTTSLDGDLDYTWNGSKNLTATIGTNIDLNLAYRSYNIDPMSGIAFRVNLPGLPIRATGSSSGFTSPTHSWTVGNLYYALSNASIGALGSATVTVPVTITTAGQWVLDASAIINTVHTTPMGTPATLTVATTVGLSDNTASTICGSKTFTVRYPGTVTAAQDVTVNLSYSGATGDFSTRPATVIIPAGSNSATFTVTSAASPTGSSDMTITLSSTDKPFATIGTPATVNVRAYPTLTAGVIGSAQFVCYGATPATLTQTTPASGGNGTYTYQWQSSTDNSTWNNITDAMAVTYSPGALTASTYYRRNVTSSTCGTVSGASVLITVYPNLTAGAIGTAHTICYGATPATLTQTTAAGGGTGSYTYQWQSSANNSAWTNITDATSATYSPGALTASTYYRRNVTSGTCGTVSSGSILITVYPNLTAGAIGTVQSICYGATPATLTQTSAAGGGTGSYTYQWQSSIDNSAWTNITDAKSATYSPGALTASTYYRRNVTSGTCGTVSSASVLITVYPNLTAGAIGAVQSICNGATPATLTQTTAAGGGTGNYTYQWQSSSDNSAWTNITDAKSATYSPGALTSSTYYRRNVTSGTCGTVSSASILITVYPVVTVNTIADKAGYVGSTISSTTFSSPTSGATFSWTNSNTSIGLAASGTGNQPQFAAVQSGTATITVTPSYNGCPGTPRTYTITIDPFGAPVNPHLRVRTE
ncbi:MAG: hypothetical protein LBK65_00215 [Tannerellaceae bacterium]|jgi:hypothetical protein|nr:hypothetical protein [Tannerellaceae bacterium]